MGKIKTYINDIPNGVRCIIAINFFVYFISLLIFIFFGVRLQDYLGAYPSYSNNFNPLQILNSIFVHKFEIFHILNNMLLFLIFAPFVERKLGSKIFILVYFICGSIGYIFCDLAYKENKIVIEEIIYKTGIDIHDIKIKDFSIDEKYIEKLSEKEYEKVILYNRVISKTVGSSGAITGIIFIYLFYMREIRKILTISFALFIIYITINNFIRPGLLLEIGDSAHFGGMIGAIIYLIIQFDWYNNCESHIKCLSLREPKRQ